MNWQSVWLAQYFTVKSTIYSRMRWAWHEDGPLGRNEGRGPDSDTSDGQMSPARTPDEWPWGLHDNMRYSASAASSEAIHDGTMRHSKAARSTQQWLTVPGQAKLPKTFPQSLEASVYSGPVVSISRTGGVYVQHFNHKHHKILHLRIFT